MPTLDELRRDQVTLDIACLDRLSRTGSLPTLPSSGQLVTCLTQHRGHPIPAPVLVQQMTATFVGAVRAFAAAHQAPTLHFEPGVRKEAVAAAPRAGFQGTEGVVFIGVAQEKAAAPPTVPPLRRQGVVFIGVAQEKAAAFKASKRTDGTAVNFQSARPAVSGTSSSFSLLDADCGPAVITVCSYAPVTLTVYLNGQEWAKRQLPTAGSAFAALDHGFRSCADPARLPAVCATLGVEPIPAFFATGLARLPLPRTPADRQAGDDYRLSIWQMAVSRTQVCAEPQQGRAGCAAVMRENRDLGRPDRVQLIFERRVQKNTPGLLRTRVVQEGVSPSLHIEYKHGHLKPYFTAGWPLRTALTSNDPTALGVQKDIRTRPHLAQLGCAVPRRLLAVQRVSHAGTRARERIQRVVPPPVPADGQRAAGWRWGDRRVLALLAALILFVPVPTGLSQRTLRPQVASALGVDLTAYTAGQMTYDLRRLRLQGLLWRVPHTQRYRVTLYGYRVALLFTKLDARVLRPACAAFAPADPVPRLRAAALAEVDRHLTALVDEAKLEQAA